MYDYDWLGWLCGIIICLGLTILCIAGAYNIIYETNHPELFRQYTNNINGNVPAIIIKDNK